MIVDGGVGAQGQGGVQLAEKEPGAVSRVDEVGVFALPAESGQVGQRLFHDRSRIGKGPVAERADGLFDAFGQRLQTLAQDFVVIAPQGVAGDIGGVRVVEDLPGIGGVRGPVIHAHADNAESPRLQLGGAAAFAAVALHPVHGSVIPPRQPGLQALFRPAQTAVAEAGLLKPQFPRPVADLFFEAGVFYMGFRVCSLSRRAHDCIV